MLAAKPVVKPIDYALYGYASGYTKETPTMMPTTMSMAMLYGYAPKLHPQTTFLSPGHRSDHYNFSWKKNKYLASCSFRKTVSFKESPPSIMIIRNPNWLTEIL
jgi:hypothetical protein